MGDFVVYRITYYGEKHPPYYIGSTSKRNLKKGYKGSPTSKRWRDLVKAEQKAFPHLYEVEVVSEHKTRKGALLAEYDLQESLNVVKSKDYYNESLACVDGFFGRDVSGELNPRFGISTPENVRSACSKANKGTVTVSEDGGKTWRKEPTEFYHANKDNLITPKGQFNYKTVEATRDRVRRGVHHFCDPEVQKKIHETRSKPQFSEEQRLNVSNNMKEYYGKWHNKKLGDNINLWRIALEIYDFLNSREDILTMSGRLKREAVCDLINYIESLGVDPRVEVRGWDKIVRKFKEGWNPHDDENYLEWRKL